MLCRRHAYEIILLPKCCCLSEGGGDLTVAWGRPGIGTWTEQCGNVFAPEEVLYLLYYYTTTVCNYYTICTNTCLYSIHNIVLYYTV